MINNFQDLFLKYKTKLSSKKETENNILSLIYETTNIKLDNSNLKLDLKNKSYKLINLRSSINFVLKERMRINNTDTLIKEKLNFNLIN